MRSARRGWSGWSSWSLLLVGTVLLVHTTAGDRQLLGVTSDTFTALSQLYSSTEGASWYTNTNWMDGDPCTDSWYGVSCSLGVVVDLEVVGEIFSEADIVQVVAEVGHGIQVEVVDVLVVDIHVVVGGVVAVPVVVEVVDASQEEEVDQVEDGHFQNQVEEAYIAERVDHFL